MRSEFLKIVLNDLFTDSQKSVIEPQFEKINENEDPSDTDVEESNQPNYAPVARKSQFDYEGLDLQAPASGTDVDSDWTKAWVFESLFVEVKGPTDHLSDRQVVWLHGLGQACERESFSVVCQLREGRNGQEHGFHQSF